MYHCLRPDGLYLKVSLQLQGKDLLLEAETPIAGYLDLLERVLLVREGDGLGVVEDCDFRGLDKYNERT